MDTLLRRTSTQRLIVSLALAFTALPAWTQSTVNAPCTVRIRPRAAADYDPSTEILLPGQVIGQQGGQVLLRIRFGVVRVELGPWGGSVPVKVGSLVEILASKRQEEGRQRLLAREIRSGAERLLIRDPQGVPLQVPVLAQL